MNIKKIETKLNNLDKIYKIVESNKNVTLINILKLSKSINNYFERSRYSKELIKTIQNKYNVTHEFLKASTFSSLFKGKNHFSTIWVYITEVEKFDTDSYKKHEVSLKKNFRLGTDVIVAIGKRAVEFATENNYDIIFQREINEVEVLSNILPQYLENYLGANGFHNIKFIINSSKISESYITVFPIHENNFNFEQAKGITHDLSHLAKVKIYPNTTSFIDNEIHNYLTYVTLSLLTESSLIYEKYNLVVQNKTLNDLEEKRRKIKIKLLNEKREIEVEQFSLLSSKRDMLHSKGE
ncbi:hypothetical protein DP067_00595 [Mycoplasmopsis anatis]|uniref:ATP synthase gamma chain n=1 Tax=Mycoplasmopsis anatis 1340 TaxID=1034808 RepID=F9QDV5_9BACT|nr:hypothetical protein [Mycoplasmopsis anatis]AWX69874.1 hypothetical protein DP067_00595 [Mycoplasmopsis anatis]EGS29132.1 hypothetical protein GIG_02903 [Mycoplasmopsis anatis 1340]